MSEELKYGEIFDLELSGRLIENALYIGVPKLQCHVPKETIPRQYRDMKPRTLLARINGKINLYVLWTYTLRSYDLRNPKIESDFYRIPELTKSEGEYANWLLEQRGL